MPELYFLSYDQWSSSLEQAGVMASTAELHGLISGLLSAGIKADSEQLFPVLYDFLHDGQALPVALKQQVSALIQATAEHLQETDFSFQLLLPGDDESLPERLEALTEWSQAFLIGFTVQQTDLSLVSDEVREAIDQLTEITKIDFQIHSDSSAEEDEENYFLVLEHVRLMVITCYTDVGAKVSLAKTTGRQLH